MERECQIALLSRHEARLLKIDRSPVAHAVAYHIYEGIGECDYPEEPVLENIVDEESLERNLLGILDLGLHSGIVVPVLIDGREAAGLWRIPDEPPAYGGNDECHHGRENEGSPPGRGRRHPEEYHQ